MTCLAPPETLSAFVAVINACATSFGGSQWPSFALMGLATLAIGGVLVLGLVGLMNSIAGAIG